jgi:hypothetical protein
MLIQSLSSPTDEIIINNTSDTLTPTHMPTVQQSNRFTAFHITIYQQNRDFALYR